MNIEAPAELIRYLEATGRIPAGEVPRVTPLAGGVSNRTVLVQPANGPAWVFKQALPKLRVAQDWFCDPARIQREALGLRWLERLAPPGAVPRFLFEDPAEHLLAMEAVPAPHQNWKTELLGGRLEPDLVRQFATLLGTIHRRSAEQRRSLAAPFEDQTYFEALRLAPYYQSAAARNPDADRFLSALVDETRATRLSLVHGDYSPKNILVQQGRLVLLDHEVIHFGDPAFDVGFSLTHLLSKARHVPGRRPEFLAAARLYWDVYQAALAGNFSDSSPAPPTESPSASALGAAALASLELRAARHTLACLLARVDGRSPLEYLSAAQRHDQRELAKRLMRASPVHLGDVIEAFAAEPSR